MSRAHIEFIQSQALPWVADAHGLEHKCLSEDADSGACTLLQRLPAGWHFGDGTPIAANEEFYVLAGAYYANGFEYAAGCYGFYPAGHERRDIYSPRGAVLLRFFDAATIPAADDPDTAARAAGRTSIPFLDSFRMVWDRRRLDHHLDHLLPARKILRIDPRSGQKTFLFMTAPQTHPTYFRGPLEWHPTPEESFLISGDLSGPLGTMRAGAYFWRPPMVAHGPFGSRGGSLSLIRFVDGPHVNHWSEEEAAFSYAAPYRPILPPALRALAHEEPALHY